MDVSIRRLKGYWRLIWLRHLLLTHFFLIGIHKDIP